MTLYSVTVKWHGPTWDSGQSAEHVPAAKRTGFAAATGTVGLISFIMLIDSEIRPLLMFTSFS